MTADVELRLLGRFAVLRNGAEVPAADFGGRKVRTLLRVLAARSGQFVSSDVLTEIVWPDRAPADPAANLHVLVTRARKALGDPTLLQSGPGGYVLVAGERCRIDAEEFIRAVDAARGRDPAGALGTLRAALAGWGEPLAEDSYADWAREYRERLTRMRQHALETAARLAIDVGEEAAAVEFASAAVDAEPLREAAVLLLVQACAAGGDMPTALRHCDQYRRLLADELGLDPSEEFAELHRRVLAGSPRSAPVAAHDRRPVTFSELAFVGRADDLRAVVGAVEPPGRGCTVFVRGASGTGKSRLLRVLAARVPTTVARAYLPEAAEPWSLLRTLLRELVGDDVSGYAALPAGLAAAVASLLPELDVAAAPEHDPETRRAFIREATARLLDVADRVVAVDDAQWADPTSLAVLESARARLPALRLVLAFRPEEVIDGGEVATTLARLRPDLDRRLGGLSAAAVADVIADDRLAALVVEQTDRTPLAVTELLRALAADGRIVRNRDGRWRAVDEAAREEAARLARQGQRHAIAQRAARLAAPEREVLDVLCLLAREAPVSLIANATGAAERAVDDRLATLYRAELVRLGDIGWTTSHDMVTETLAPQIGEADRARLHAALGRALAGADADRAEQARHWMRAGDPARAAAAFELAAAQALDAFADLEAAQLAAAGLDLGPPPEIGARLHEIRAEARTRAGDLAGARADLAAALAVHAAGPPRARVLGRLAMLASGAEDLVRAAELAELAVVEAGTDDAAQAHALEIASVLDMNLDRAERAAERSARALAIYRRVGDARGTARILDARAMATFLAGQVEAGQAALRQAADLFEDSGDLVRVVTPRSTSGHALVFCGRVEDGLETTTAALELARTLGHPEGQTYALWHRAEALAESGRVDEASAEAREAHAIAGRIGHRGWTATSWRAIGIAAQAGGDLDIALDAFTRSLELAENLDLFASWAAARSALVLVALGRCAAAAPLVERALAEGPPLARYEANLAHAELAAATGQPDARDIARAALAVAEHGGVRQGRDRLVALAT